MAKQRIANYVFLPGVSSNSNAYPNAYSLIQQNAEFIKAEAVAYINSNIALDNASNLYPNAVTLLTNNKAFIIDEIIAWVAAQVAAAGIGTTWYGYTYSTASCRRDTGLLIDAYIYDIRYGGNEKTIDIAKNFWQGGTAQLISPTQEILGFAQIINLINNYILPKVSYVSQQSPITSTQNVSGTASEAGVTTLITALGAIITAVIPGGLSTLPTVTYSVRNYAGYLFDSTKCYRDIGFVIDAYLNDLRYGGNARTRFIASKFWHGDIPQLGGDRKPEITGQTFIRNLINNTILTGAAYTPLQVGEPRITLPLVIAESGTTARVTSLSTALINVLTNGLTSLPTLVNGATTIKLQGKFKLSQLLLITNATSNTILYNFADSTAGATISYDSTGNTGLGEPYDDDFVAYRNTADYVTTITLEADTSTASVTDDIQVFTEAKEQRTRPYDFGTDAIERQRVAQPQSMLDADFEYGLQPTKWQAIGIGRGYPSIYEIPGTDVQVATVVTDASAGTGGTGESLITVTTQSAHGFSIGTPITIRSLANTISGFNRAEGTFLVINVTQFTFTYYATAKVGTSNGQVLATTYTQLRKGAFYTGAAIGAPVFSVYSNGVSGTFTTKFITASGTDQIAVSGPVPALGVPISGTGIDSGTQVTGTVGSGGLAVTASIGLPVNIGDTVINVIDSTGILEGMAIDNGSGTAVFVSSIAGTDISLTQPVTTARSGSTQTYTNISGTNITPGGSSATFSVDRTDGLYANLQIVDGGTSYVANTKIKILGSALGGVDVTNDIILKVATVDVAGVITAVTLLSGTSVIGERSYSALLQDATIGSGAGATFDISTSAGIYLATIVAPGNDYLFGDTLTFLGSALGGVDVTNDLTITVTSATSGAGNILTFDVAGAPGTNDTTFTPLTGTKITTGTGASFDVTRSGGSYITVVPNLSGGNYSPNDVITIIGTNLGGTTTANDLTITVTSTGLSGDITGVSASGTSATGATVDFYSAVSLSAITTSAIADGITITTSAIATIQIAFSSPHGLVPGASLLVDISSAGTNHAFARGPFYVESVPTLTTLRYTARAIGALDTNTPLAGIIYSRPDSFFIHRPYDGGVQLGTGGPAHGAQAIRMSKKYIRYQSGKGINYCTGALFAPSYNLQALTADGVAIGSFITVVTDDVDHGCQVGGQIKIDGVDTKGYNGSYTITDIVNERTLKVQTTTVLASTTATLSTNVQMSVLKWHGATVRAGTFDDQNGIYFQYDGQDFAVGRRSSTFQLSGTVSVLKDSNLVTGSNTRFRDQIKAGDRITIKGMTHVVTNVTSNTAMTVTPDYRGASNAVQAKACLVVDTVIKQQDFNLDKLDGTGPSGYNIDLTKMQMIGMQWSWYAVGFIDFMLRGSDGNFVFFHRIRNSNVNTEAYMRTGNQPVRYEVINESGKSKLASSITATQTSITLTDASDFPQESGIVYIDNELIAFSGKTGNTLTGCTRDAPMTNFVGGAQRTFRAAAATTHEYNTGVILVSNTISPIISHWGSAMLTDGNFDSDRGYLFNYASTGIQASTTKQTAFLIRLAPSVSNAIIGDLGDRELINRAQLLLKAIEVTSDSGTGGLVVEGVLNPQNYPTDPTAITWSGLSGSSQGGQPSFAQVAPGGSVNWSGGASTTTSTATTTAALTGNATVPNNALFGSAIGSNILYVTKSSWDTLGAAAGFSVATAETKYPSGTTVSSVAPNPASIATTLGLITGTATVPNNGAFATTTAQNFVNFTQASWQALGAGVGSKVYSSDFPAGTTVQTVNGPGVYLGISYYQVVFTANQSIGHGINSTVTFYETGQALINATTLNFTQASWVGLPIGTAVVTNTVNDTGKFAVGTQISSISALKRFAGVNYYTIGFNTGLLAPQAPMVSITFSFTAYYQLVLSKTATSTISANATVAFTPAVIATNTSFLYFTQASWETLTSTYGATTGTEVVDVLKFPSGTKIASINAVATFASTAYYRVNFTQSSIAAITAASTISFQFGLPPYAQPGETVFSFISAPGAIGSLDLTDLKELTNTTLGGRGTYPNGPDVLAINVYRASGTGNIPTNVIVRWGEAQA